MEQFLRQLQTIPEAAELIRRVEEGGCPAAVSGLQPVQRACVGAAVAAACGRPAVFLCGDEREVQVLSADLETLTGRRPVTLLGREWQFRPGAVGSRDWERSRLAALYALAQGDAPVVVATADGLMARTLPPETLRSLAITLEVGGQAELGALAEQLLSAGYTRCEQVEGVGQFALRGGILDVFSPLMDQPVRCEFFDDEIDSMGAFDPGTQRRTRNVSSARILPAAEVLPHCAPGGLPGLADQLTALAEKLAKKQKTEAIVQTLREDAERLRSGAAPGAADRYLAAIYPTVTAGVHYLPPDAVVFLSESGRVDERVKNTVLQQKQDVEALLSAGVLAGEYAHLTLTAEELYAALEDFPVILEDSLPTSRHPLRPRGLLTMNAKQLSSYGGSLETAVTDLEHYRSSGSAVLVLCADNGVVAQGVSQTDASVTRAVLENLTARRTSVCRMAAAARCAVVPVDMGIAGAPVAGAAEYRIAPGTCDFTAGPAMTRAQAVQAIAAGLALVRAQKRAGVQLLATGEMGIGNTTTSSAVASVLLGRPVAEMTGRGAGLSDAGLQRKIEVIERGIAVNHPDAADPLGVLAALGGFDIAGLCGVFLGGALEQIPIVMDGFISSVAALCAVRLCPGADKAVFASHVSAEPAARLVLEALHKKPLITADLHLGEGTGAVASLPLWDMALAVYHGCYSFAEGGIAPYTPQC